MSKRMGLFVAFAAWPLLRVEKTIDVGVYITTILNRTGGMWNLTIQKTWNSRFFIPLLST